MNYWDSLPEDNEYISDYVNKFGETSFCNNANVSKQVSFAEPIHVAATVKNKKNTGEILVDGGCDTTLVGDGFRVESTTSRKMTVQGFSDTIKMNSLPVVTAVTAVGIDSTTYLVVVNEAIYVRGNETSLLSTFQARSHGVEVHDIAKIHGGKQCIVVDEIEVPLDVKNGLLVCGCREPTDIKFGGSGKGVLIQQILLLLFVTQIPIYLV